MQIPAPVQDSLLVGNQADLSQSGQQQTPHTKFRVAILQVAHQQFMDLLTQEQKKLHQSLQILETATEKIISNQNYQLFADLIMANLNSIKPFDEQVILSDFTTNEPIKIPLKKGLSPQKNAENFYRKSKNQNIQITRNKEQILLKKERLKAIHEAISQLETSETVDEISSVISPFEKLKLEKG